MNTNEWGFVTQVEHQRRERGWPPTLEWIRLTQSITHRPGWETQQMSQALNARGRGLIR